MLLTPAVGGRFAQWRDLAKRASEFVLRALNVVLRLDIRRQRGGGLRNPSAWLILSNADGLEI